MSKVKKILNISVPYPIGGILQSDILFIKLWKMILIVVGIVILCMVTR